MAYRLEVNVTVGPDVIATEMLAVPSNSSRNQHDSNPKDSDLKNGNTTPICNIMGTISVAQSRDSGD